MFWCLVFVVCCLVLCFGVMLYDVGMGWRSWDLCVLVIYLLGWVSGFWVWVWI